MSDSLANWLRQVADGDEQAAHEIWDRYFSRLVRLAAKNLRGIPKREADEEDVALSVLKSFLCRHKSGQFGELEGADVWKLLVTITVRKAGGRKRRHFAQKRGRGRIRGESALGDGTASDRAPGIDRVAGKDPPPELVVLFRETCEQKLEALTPSLRKVAVLRLEGYTVREIAERLDCIPRTVERKLARIRFLWEGDLD